jgi:thiol-disulfide isomerase/thioredoxin
MYKSSILMICLAPILLSISLSGFAAENPIYTKAKNAKELSEAIPLYWQFLMESKDDPGVTMATEDFADRLSEAKNYGELLRLGSYLQSLKDASVNALNSIAWALATGDTALDKAATFANTAIEVQKLSMKQPPPVDRSVKAWKERQGWTLSTLLDTEGYIFLKQNKADKALPDLLTADSLGDDPEILVHVAQAYLKLGKPDEALIKATEALYSYEQDDHKALDLIITEAYQKAHGSGEGLKEYRAKRLDELRKEEYNKLRADKINLPAKEFNLNTLSGNKVKLSDHRGKVIIVDFWATWCGPCKRELPLLQKAYSKWKKQGIVLLAVSTDKDTAKVKPFIDQNKYTFPVLFNENTSKDYDVSGIPTLFLVDKAGNVQYKHVGYRPDIVDVVDFQLKELQK